MEIKRLTRFLVGILWKVNVCEIFLFSCNLVVRQSLPRQLDHTDRKQMTSQLITGKATKPSYLRLLLGTTTANALLWLGWYQHWQQRSLLSLLWYQHWAVTYLLTILIFKSDVILNESTPAVTQNKILTALGAVENLRVVRYRAGACLRSRSPQWHLERDL